MVSKNLSVSLWSTLTPIISDMAKYNGLKFFLDILAKMNVLKKFYTQVDVTTKFCDSMMFNFLNNLMNISMILIGCYYLVSMILSVGLGPKKLAPPSLKKKPALFVSFR